MSAASVPSRRGVGDVAVVTVSYDSASVLGSFLDSIEAAAESPVDVVVVDNASPEVASVRGVVDRPRVRFLPLAENRGYGAGMNLGVASLSPAVRWVVLANPDVVFAPGAIDRLVEAAVGRPEVGAVGPRVLTPDGADYPSARRLPSLRIGVGHALLGRAFPRNPWTRLYRADELPPDQERAAGWLSGSCLLVVRDVFDALGGFDESYFMYFEDVDLGARVGAAGYVNLYWPSAEVVHSGAHSTTSRRAAMEKAHHASAYRYIAQKYNQWYLWPLRAVLRAGIGVRGAVARYGRTRRVP